jgi:hypothetical protein
VEPIQPTVQRIQGALSPGIKRLELGTDYSLPSTDEAENVWSAINLSSDIHVCDVM